MTLRDAAIGFGLAVFCFGFSDCGTPDPVRYSGLQSSAQLAPNRQDETGRIPFRYAAEVDGKGHRRLMIDPVEIYRGLDNQFGGGLR